MRERENTYTTEDPLMKKMKPSASVGCGTIKNSGSDPHAYLGHFRSPEVVKRGHNFGFPGLGGVFGGGNDKPKPVPGVNAPPTKKQLANPVFREKNQAAAAKSDVRQAKKTGGDVAGAKANLATVKADKKQTFANIKSARQDVRAAKKSPPTSDALSGANPLSEARANLKAAKQTAKSKYAGAVKNRAMQKKSTGGGGSGLGKLIGKMNPF